MDRANTRDDERKELAETLLTLGASYLTSAESLVSTARTSANKLGLDPEKHAFNGDLSPSIYLLMSYGFELLLKATLVLNGASQRDLKRIGHNLVEALDRAEEAGFRCDAPKLREVVTALHETHSSNYFRYGGPDFVNLPPLETSLPTLERLTVQVGALIYGYAVPAMPQSHSP